MKNTIVASIVMAIPLLSFSQFNFMENYYDYRWRELPDMQNARFYMYAKKTDSGWFRTDYYLLDKKPKPQMIGLYTDKETKNRNGIFKWYFPYGGLKTYGKYVNNKKEGTWYDFFENGEMRDSMNYKNGNSAGISLSWYENGFQRDSLNADDKGNAVYVKWFDNGLPSEGGRYVEFIKKHGKWQYFNKQGHLSQLEIYEKGILQSRQNYNDDGTPIADTALNTNEATFPGGDKAWGKYLDHNLKFPSNLDLINSQSVVVVVAATINEEGSIINLEMTVPFQKDFDIITYEALKKSPKWQPAMDHNRKVYAQIQQSVIYSQESY